MTERRSGTSRFRFAALPVAIVLTALAVALGVGLFAPLDAVRALMDEDGLVENGTAVVYGLAIVAVWAVRHPGFGRPAATASTIILVACVAREISLRRHLNALTADGCCIGDWTGGVLLLLLLISAIALTAYYYRPVWKGLAQRRPMSMTIATIAFTLAISQLMDRMPKLMEAIEVVLGERARVVALSIEETLELAVPLLIIALALQARSQTDSARSLNRLQAKE